MTNYPQALRGPRCVPLRPSWRTTGIRWMRDSTLQPTSHTGKPMRCSVARLALILLPAISAYAQTAATSPDFFEMKIRPVLANSCYGCHASTAMGGLRLDSRDALLKG